MADRERHRAAHARVHGAVRRLGCVRLVMMGVPDEAADDCDYQQARRRSTLVSAWRSASYGAALGPVWF
jgi:hypothetical protein